MTIYHNGTYWFGSIPPNEKDATPRYWNPFGEYRETGNLQIAVEINVPTKLNESRPRIISVTRSSWEYESIGSRRRSPANHDSVGEQQNRRTRWAAFLDPSKTAILVFHGPVPMRFEGDAR
jgi:hypothetical protein